tara:strand:+ start:880 stop:1062 length:183 start_codon:yes stop_codon:yes gene_type:complete
MELIEFLDAIKEQKGWSDESLIEQMAVFIEQNDLSEGLEEHLLDEEAEIISEDRLDFEEE